EQLVERAEAPGEEDEALGRLDEHHLPRVEVAEGDGEVDVGVRRLLVRKLDVEAHREAAALFRTAVRRFHRARPAAGDDREAGLRQRTPAGSGLLVFGVVARRARRAEDGCRRAWDPLDRLEAHAQLLRDQLDVSLDVAVVVLEDAAVDGHAGAQRRFCGTWAAIMPITSSAARPKNATVASCALPGVPPRRIVLIERHIEPPSRIPIGAMLI